MARTFKDAPLKVRIERGWVYYTKTTTVGGTSYRERGYGPKGVRFAKRLAGKRRRQGRSDIKALRELDLTTVWCSD
jgi:hypothetical protein